MLVALLGRQSGLLRSVVGSEHRVWQTEDQISGEVLRDRGVECVVSFGYRHVLRDDAMEAVCGNAVNLHISMLPWNRGADPNLWSWLENTPRGVSLHWMAARVDEGPLIAQRSVDLDVDGTLRSSYDVLEQAICELFEDTWPSIASRAAATIPQPSGGSHHRSADKEPHLHALHSGWDTPCADVLAYGQRVGLWTDHR
jgi:methionyl-tRNA formyltransferase